ncbi:hypothetical protein U0070_002916, partial [Myodes glareolus]
TLHKSCPLMLQKTPETTPYVNLDAVKALGCAVNKGRHPGSHELSHHPQVHSCVRSLSGSCPVAYQCQTFGMLREIMNFNCDIQLSDSLFLKKFFYVHEATDSSHKPQ